MNNMEGLLKTVLIVFVTACVVFVVTSSYYINNVVKSKEIETYDYSGDFTKLKEVLKLVEKDFLYDNYTLQDLEEGAIEGLLEKLDDPYTSYFNKSATESFLTETEGSYEGVGMYITFGKDLEWPMVLSLFKNSPADEAGVKAGDYIYAISGEKITKDTSLEEVAHSLKGEAGTKVEVTFVRISGEDSQEEYTVILERRRIEITSFETDVLEGNIGYIKFTSFDEDADIQFSNAYNQLVKVKKVNGIIIDLRDNPGGLLNKVLKIADRLVPEGTITYTVDRNGKKDVKKSDARKTDVPIVIIANEKSASASEILTAAVKDYGVGKIVGKTTYGKGLVQEFVGLKDGTYVKLTVAEYFSPNGTKINESGVSPDFEVEDDLDTAEDEQLNKAIEVIKNF